MAPVRRRALRPRARRERAGCSAVKPGSTTTTVPATRRQSRRTPPRRDCRSGRRRGRSCRPRPRSCDLRRASSRSARRRPAARSTSATALPPAGPALAASSGRRRPTGRRSARMPSSATSTAMTASDDPGTRRRRPSGARSETRRRVRRRRAARACAGGPRLGHAVPAASVARRSDGARPLQALVEGDELLVRRPPCRAGRGSARRRTRARPPERARASAGTAAAARAANSVAVVPGETRDERALVEARGDRAELLLDRHDPVAGTEPPRGRGAQVGGRAACRPRRTGNAGHRARPPVQAGTAEDQERGDDQRRRSRARRRPAGAPVRRSPPGPWNSDASQSCTALDARSNQVGFAAWYSGLRELFARSTPAPPASSGRRGMPRKCSRAARRACGRRAACGCCAGREIRVGQRPDPPGAPRRSARARGRGPPCASGGRCRASATADVWTTLPIAPTIDVTTLARTLTLSWLTSNWRHRARCRRSTEVGAKMPADDAAEQAERGWRRSA